MTSSKRCLALGFAALWLLTPVVCAAQDQLLVEKDYDSLSGDDQWKYSDVWCVAALDIAVDAPGYNRDNLQYARKVNHDEFIDGEGGTEEEFAANLDYAIRYYKDALAANRFTLDDLLDGCVADPKG